MIVETWHTKFVTEQAPFPSIRGGETCPTKRFTVMLMCTANNTVSVMSANRQLDCCKGRARELMMLGD